jgi:hypothetical protein
MAGLESARRLKLVGRGMSGKLKAVFHLSCPAILEAQAMERRLWCRFKLPCESYCKAAELFKQGILPRRRRRVLNEFWSEEKVRLG